MDHYWVIKFDKAYLLANQKDLILEPGIDETSTTWGLNPDKKDIAKFNSLAKALAAKSLFGGKVYVRRKRKPTKYMSNRLYWVKTYEGDVYDIALCTVDCDPCGVLLSKDYIWHIPCMGSYKTKELFHIGPMLKEKPPEDEIPSTTNE